MPACSFPAGNPLCRTVPDVAPYLPDRTAAHMTVQAFAQVFSAGQALLGKHLEATMLRRVDWLYPAGPQAPAAPHALPPRPAERDL